MKVAVDAMGGDSAPDMVVVGAAEAANEFDIDITLVGNREVIEEKLLAQPGGSRIAIHHCKETIGMGELPLKAVRKKKNASIRVAFDLVKSGVMDAVISAGNSGATLAAGVLTLGRLKGVERPAIAGAFPGEKGQVVVIDVGANVDCRPSQLFQFGLMAEAYATSCLGMVAPKIGLLSIGEEGSKGNEQVLLSHKLFVDSSLNFVGNVEGRDIFAGDVQIVVCDGFVGNVALKLSEGMAETMLKVLKKEMKSSFLGKTAFRVARKCFLEFERKMDYEEIGGAPLLGINGVGIVCHGDSSSKAIRNAIKLADQYVKHRVLEKMEHQLARA